jgi:DNA-3-methyladenine glycosylase
VSHDPNAAPSARRSHFAARGAVLPPSFYDRPTARVARALLGCELESHVGGEVTRGRIVEVEAYLGPHDASCHAAVGLTARNRHLHGAPGTAYVYRIYGTHWCVNAVTRRVGYGSAVLIRALAPLEGLDVMQRRRGDAKVSDLTNGPGKLCRALGITGALDGTPLDSAFLRLLRGRSVPERSVVVSPRIGISKAAEWPLRCFVGDDPHVSPTPRHFTCFTLRESEVWLNTRRLR